MGHPSAGTTPAHVTRGDFACRERPWHSARQLLSLQQLPGRAEPGARDLPSAMGVKDVIRKELGSLHGMPLYESFIEGWPQVETFQARPDDLLISTYPKSGEWPRRRALGG